ncbi:MAG: polysaccharide biosynthesis protein [Clostridia bacterium]|nr:polysaccharide biosynthesis protein [Clostridia bacterium]
MNNKSGEKIVNKKQSFMAGVFTIIFAQIIIKILGLVYRVVITNIPYFGDEGNGLYAHGYQIYMLLLAIASIGVPSAISKLVSERIAVGKRKEAHYIFKVALLLFGMIGFIGSAFLFFSAGFIANKIGNPDIQGIMIVLSPAVFFVAVAAVIRGYFNGLYNMKVSSNSQVIEQVFKTILTVVLVLVVYYLTIKSPSEIAEKLNWSESNVTVVMAIVANAASTIATAIGLLYAILYYQRSKKEIWKEINESKVEYKKEKMTKVMKTILAISIPISLASIISAINRNIDNFTVVNGLKSVLMGSFSMVESVVQSEAERLYGILSGRVDTLIGLPTALNVAFSTALVPVVSEAMANKDLKTAVRRINFSIRTTLLIAFPCAIGMCVLAGPILKLIYPAVPLNEAELLLQISSFAIIFTLLNQTVAGALQGLGKVAIPAISLACGATVKFILNVILVRNPAIGIYGAAITSVIAGMVTGMIEITALHKTIKLNSNFYKTVIKPAIAVGIMGVVTYFFHIWFETYIRAGSIATIVSILVAVVVYLLAILELKILDRDDYHMLPYGDKIYQFLEKIKLVK